MQNNPTIDLNSGTQVVYTNLDREVIVAPIEKIELLLRDHHDIVKRKISWVNPVGLLLSLITTILTANFENNALGLPAHYWSAAFHISAFITLVWTLKVSWDAYTNRKEGTVKDFIKKLKIQTSNQPNN